MPRKLPFHPQGSSTGEIELLDSEFESYGEFHRFASSNVDPLDLL